MAKQEKVFEEVPAPQPEAQMAEDAALQTPTLEALEERIDELEARIEALETFEPVRGDAENLVDSSARRAAREKRAARRAKRRAVEGA